MASRYKPKVVKQSEQGQPRYAFSVKAEFVEPVDKALLGLRSADVTKSFSEIICEAIIAYAKQRKIDLS